MSPLLLPLRYGYGITHTLLFVVSRHGWRSGVIAWASSVAFYGSSLSRRNTTNATPSPPSSPHEHQHVTPTFTAIMNMVPITVSPLLSCYGSRPPAMPSQLAGIYGTNSPTVTIIIITPRQPPASGHEQWESAVHNTII